MFLYALFLSIALGQEAIAIGAGETAPFEGVLIPREMAIEILSDEYASKLRNQEELLLQKEQCELKLNFTNDLYSSKIETYEEEFEYLNKALKNRNDMILKENSNLSKSINFIGGFAGGTIITLAVLWSVNSVNNVSGN